MSVDNSRNQTEGDSIVVAGVPEHFNLPWHLAIELGQFEDRGLHVSFDEVHGGTGEMSQRLNQGACDVAVVLTEGCVAALLNGVGGRIVKAYVDSPLLWGIHVSAKSEITLADQIKDLRYAISRPGSGSHIMSIVDAAERDWSTESMKFVEVGSLKGARAALEKNDADVFFWERFTTSPLVRSGEFRWLADRAADWPAFVICATEEMVQNRSAELRSMLEILNSSCSHLMHSPDACETIARRYNIDLDAVREWFQMTRWNTGFDLDRSSFKSVKHYLSRLGIVADHSREIDELCCDLSNMSR